MNSYFASQLICLSYMRNKLAYKSISALKKKKKKELNHKSYTNGKS